MGTIPSTRPGLLPPSHSQGALLVREKLRINEEALHLIMAGIVGVHWRRDEYRLPDGRSNSFKWMLAFGNSGNFLLKSRMRLPQWKLIVIPTIGGLLAGLVLYFRSAPSLEILALSNLLRSGRRRRMAVLPVRSALVCAASSLVRPSALVRQSDAKVSLLKLPRLCLRTMGRLRQIGRLIVCVFSWPAGAAAGIGAGCNAPVAGRGVARRKSFSRKFFP
jgi:hypothetical protein